MEAHGTWKGSERAADGPWTGASTDALTLITLIRGGGGARWEARDKESTGKVPRVCRGVSWCVDSRGAWCGVSSALPRLDNSARGSRQSLTQSRQRRRSIVKKAE